MSYRLLEGHVLDRLRALPDESVHCCVTSPPYWGLRDYRIEPSVWGGDPACAHEWVTEQVEREMRHGLGLKDSPTNTRGGAIKCVEVGKQRLQRGECIHCGAWLGCFGLEPTPEMYIAHAVLIFSEVWRVLRKDGTCWINLGDSYHTGASGRGTQGASGQRFGRRHTQPNLKSGSVSDTLKPKDLVGLPWRVAFALQSDGWYLRQDIIWSKPNPMPESVRDRCTKAHEYLFLLSKSARYYYDAEAIKEPVTRNAHHRGNGVNPKAVAGWAQGSGDHSAIGHARRNERRGGKLLERSRLLNANLKNGLRPRQNESFSAAVNGLVESRNKRSVWEIATEPFAEAHFATFPTELVRPCILAGSPPNGVVIDPFNGAGTTGLVALRHGRNYVGIDLNSDYIEMSHRRIQGDAPLLNREASGFEFLPKPQQGELLCLPNP